MQSKNKMFSKFTSILQHAVEAVSDLVIRSFFYIFYAVMSEKVVL